MPKCELAYIIKDLPVSTAIQRVYVGTNNLYVIQVKDKTTQYLSRCKIDGNAAVHDSHMILKNCGHSQTLEWYQHNGKDYFLVNIKPYGTNNNNRRWGMHLGRVQYVPGKTIEDYTKIKRLSGITDYRAEFALTSDRKKLLVWTKSIRSAHAYRVYYFASVNNLMDRAKKSYVSINSLSPISKEFLMNSDGNKLLPYGSMQGIEYSNGGKIYILGGGIGATPVINTVTMRNNKLTISKTSKLQHVDFNKYTEPEGIQIKGDYIYFGVSNKKSSTPANVYRIRKDEL